MTSFLLPLPSSGQHPGPVGNFQNTITDIKNFMFETLCRKFPEVLAAKQAQAGRLCLPLDGFNINLSRAVNASNACLTAGKAALQSFGGKDLKIVPIERFKCEML